MIGLGKVRLFPRHRNSAMPFPGASNALARFIVLDLTRVRAGPTCVRQLADWGANVVKIEAPRIYQKEIATSVSSRSAAQTAGAGRSARAACLARAYG